MNKLEVPLSKQDLGSLFSTKVEKVDNNHFCIRTKTHNIHIKNPKITWEQPYTEPDGATIKYIDTTETVIAPTSTTRTELFFNSVASIKNYPDLALFDSVILDSPIISPIELLKNKQFSYNLDYHLYDFGTGEDIELYDDEKSLSEKEWDAMFTKEQLEAIAEKLPQKVRRIEPDNEHLVMYFDKIFFDFYKQNHNRETNGQYVEATVLFFEEFNSKEAKWLEKHGITNWSIYHVDLRLSKTVKSEQELISFMTNVLNHFKHKDLLEPYMTMNQY